MTDTTQLKTVTAPTLDQQKAIAGAFLAIQNANKNLRSQPDMPKIAVEGLENVNDALHTAQANAKNWSDNITAGIQNQMQSIVDYNKLYSGLASSINAAIAEIKNATDQSPPSPGTMSNLAAELQALQQQVAQQLYGEGGSPTSPTAKSALGVYNLITAYQTAVSLDEKTFKGFHQIAMSDKSGIAADIQNKLADIRSDNSAISTDRAMIAGGAAAIVTGLLIILVGAVLDLATAGATTAIIVGGAVVVAAGIGTTVAGAVDLHNKEADIVKKTQELADDRAELAALNTIGNSSVTIATLTDHIYTALDEIKTVWQQMDNNLSSVVNALSLPEADLKKWIQQQDPSQNPSYFVMGTILEAQFTAPQADWASAEQTAAMILNNLGSIQVMTPKLKDGQPYPTYEQIADYARSNA